MQHDAWAKSCRSDRHLNTIFSYKEGMSTQQGLSCNMSLMDSKIKLKTLPCNLIEIYPRPKGFYKRFNHLRTVPTIVTAHTFCASRDTQVFYGWCLLIQGYLLWFKTIRGKQNSASGFGIQKENWG